MRPGFINSFQPARDPVDPFSPTASLSNEQFGYPQGWPGTIDDTAYPSVYTGFSPPAASIADEQFGYPQGWPGTIDDTAYPSTYTGFSPPAASIVDEQFVPTTDGGTWPL